MQLVIALLLLVAIIVGVLNLVRNKVRESDEAERHFDDVLTKADRIRLHFGSHAADAYLDKKL